MRRLLKWKRLRWFAIGAVARFVLRRTASRRVDQATADIEERLPRPVRRMVQAVPADAVRAGGSVVVAGRTAKRVALGTRRASRFAGDGGRRVTEGMHRIRSIGQEISDEAEHKRRELKADYLRITEGDSAADDALLDLRAEEDRFDLDDPADLPAVKEPVRRGRWRADRRLGTAAVNRVQRSYHRPTRPWDR